MTMVLNHRGASQGGRFCSDDYRQSVYNRLTLRPRHECLEARLATVERESDTHVTGKQRHVLSRRLDELNVSNSTRESKHYTHRFEGAK